MPRGASNGYSISQLEKLLRDRRGRLTGLERRRNKLSRELRSVESAIRGLGGGGRSGAGRARNEVSLNETIVRILKKAGNAVSVGDIMKRALSGGYRSNSPNFRSIVNQALIKDKRIAKSGVRGSYVLKS